MEFLSHKSEIADTFSNVRSFSFQEKKTPILDEESVNFLLDAILDFKSNLKEKTDRIYNVNERLEKITWFNDLDEESLMLLNDIISSSKDLRTSLIRHYISMNNFRKKGIAKDEIKDFKNSIDELKESYEDLESVFFFLPEMPDFVETTAKLSLV
jgi:polyribonucleotide nucleotidyltransferase